MPNMKNDPNEYRKENYRLLREAGFSAKEAREHRKKSRAIVKQLCEDKQAYNLQNKQQRKKAELKEIARQRQIREKHAKEKRETGLSRAEIHQAGLARKKACDDCVEQFGWSPEDAEAFVSGRENNVEGEPEEVGEAELEEVLLEDIGKLGRYKMVQLEFYASKKLGYVVDTSFGLQVIKAKLIAKARIKLGQLTADDDPTGDDCLSKRVERIIPRYVKHPVNGKVFESSPALVANIKKSGLIPCTKDGRRLKSHEYFVPSPRERATDVVLELRQSSNMNFGTFGGDRWF